MLVEFEQCIQPVELQCFEYIKWIERLESVQREFVAVIHFLGVLRFFRIVWFFCIPEQRIEWPEHLQRVECVQRDLAKFALQYLQFIEWIKQVQRQLVGVERVKYLQWVEWIKQVQRQLVGLERVKHLQRVEWIKRHFQWVEHNIQWSFQWNIKRWQPDQFGFECHVKCHEQHDIVRFFGIAVAIEWFIRKSIAIVWLAVIRDIVGNVVRGIIRIRQQRDIERWQWRKRWQRRFRHVIRREWNVERHIIRFWHVVRFGNVKRFWWVGGFVWSVGRFRFERIWCGVHHRCDER